MPSPAKLTKAQRGKRAIMGGLTAEELFDDLSAEYRRMKKEGKRAEATRLGLELVPYLKPKLKAVDLTQTSDVRVTISIGGDDPAHD